MNIVEEVQRAGLGGRGGAGFSTAVKLALAQRHRATLIVNACDGELGALKDGWVVEHHLDALMEGADVIGLEGVRYAAHRGSETSARLRAAGLDVLETPPRYVSFEASSLVSLAHGGTARPVTKRRPLVFGGADSEGNPLRPTLVLNAETVWRVAQIARHGAGWFRSFGTADEPGPRLATVTGHVTAPGVFEAAAGVPVPELLDRAGTLPADAALVGGLGGAFADVTQLRRLAWTTPALSTLGAGVGPGILYVLDPRQCPLDTVTGMLQYAAGESAGQCGPCMFGLPTMFHLWQRFLATPGRDAWEPLDRQLALMTGRGACRYPDGVAYFTRSALRTFDAHLRSGCRGGTCTVEPRRTERVPV